MAHISRQELKKDELADFGERVAEWFREHDRLVSAILAAILIALIAWKGYGKFHNDKIARANLEYNTVVQNYNMALGQTDLKQRKDLLGAVITEGERFVERYSNLGIGETTQMMLGNAHYYMALASADDREAATEQRRRAREAFEKYLAMADTPEEKAAGQIALGNLIEYQLFTEQDMNLRRDAVAAYDEAIKLAPNSYLAAQAKLAKGRVLQALTGREDDARALFEEVANERKIAAVQDETTTPTEERRETPEERMAQRNAEMIREVMQVSYADQAREALTRLKGLPDEPVTTATAAATSPAADVTTAAQGQ
jgi:tetratricopeptide (TPR) repeat protein